MVIGGGGGGGNECYRLYVVRKGTCNLQTEVDNPLKTLLNTIQIVPFYNKRFEVAFKGMSPS